LRGTELVVGIVEMVVVRKGGGQRDAGGAGTVASV